MTNKHEKAPSLVGTGPGAEGGTRQTGTLSSTPAPSPEPNRPAADQRTGLDESEILRLASLPAGRELDEAVALAMGWEQTKDKEAPEGWDVWFTTGRKSWWERLPEFSTDIAATAIVLEEMHRRKWYPTLEGGDWIFEGRGWKAYIGPYATYRCDAFADTLPLAICRAALKAALFAKGVTE